MKKCYKCQAPYVEPNGPGFQDVCEGCGSYLHCCQNCKFFDQYAHNNCTEPQAEWVSDPNGMNCCEYFIFRLPAGAGRIIDDDGGRRFRKADWRNVNKDGGAGSRGGPGRPRHAAGNPFASGGGRGGSDQKAKKAREALDNLFKKE